MQNSIPIIVLFQVPFCLFTHSSVNFFGQHLPFCLFWNCDMTQSSVFNQIFPHPSLWVFSATLVFLGVNFKWCFLDISSHQRSNGNTISFHKTCSPDIWPIPVTGGISSSFIPLSCWCFELAQKSYLRTSGP